MELLTQSWLIPDTVTYRRTTDEPGDGPLIGVDNPAQLDIHVGARTDAGRQVDISRVRRNISGTVSGPSHVGLFFEPCLDGGGTKIVSWSFGKGTPQLNRLVLCDAPKPTPCF